MKTLRGRIVLLLFVLVAALSALHLASTWLATEAYHREVLQQLDRDLAPHIVSEKLLLTDGEVNQEALDEIFHMMMVINPSVELYLLDAEGSVLAYSAPPGRVRLDRVSLEPIRSFLRDPSALQLGDNPRDPENPKPFSAAAIPGREGPDGFLYVILGGDLSDSARERLRASHILRTSIAVTLLGLAAATLLGSWIASRLTKRLASLTKRVEQVLEQKLDDRPKDTLPPTDQISRLEENFDALSARLDSYLAEREGLYRAHRELISNVSHDLRTPLAALRGYLETLQLKESSLSPEDREEYLAISLRHAERLGRLIDELFELTRLDQPDPDLTMEPFSPAELAHDAVQRFRLQAATKGVGIEAITRPAPHVVGDLGLIDRALANLLDNALRHTDSGGSVEVRVEPSGSRVEVQVRDTGSGIPTEDLAHIFDRFYSRTQDSDSGTGLGLAIARRIAELHHSELEVESTEGRGSTFRFSLPSETAISSGTSSPVTLS